MDKIITYYYTPRTLLEAMYYMNCIFKRNIATVIRREDLKHIPVTKRHLQLAICIIKKEDATGEVIQVTSSIETVTAMQSPKDEVAIKMKEEGFVYIFNKYKKKHHYPVYKIGDCETGKEPIYFTKDSDCDDEGMYGYTLYTTEDMLSSSTYLSEVDVHEDADEEQEIAEHLKNYGYPAGSYELIEIW